MLFFITYLFSTINMHGALQIIEHKRSLCSEDLTIKDYIMGNYRGRDWGKGKGKQKDYVF